jgi:hypothetical protein
VVMTPTAVVQNYGTVPHAINKLSTSSNLKQESENFFATEHFFSVSVPEGFWEESLSTKACTSLTNKIFFNISSGAPDPRTNECLKSIKKEQSSNTEKKKNPIIELLLAAKQSSSLSPEALFACKSVAVKQKEESTKDKAKILGGKQAQALIDVDEVMLKGVDKALHVCA